MSTTPCKRIEGLKTIHGPFALCLLLLSFAPLAQALPLLSDIGNTAFVRFVTEKLDFWDLILTVAEFASLFFFLSLLALYFCKKRRWFKRENALWDKLTYLYYLYIPVVLVIFGMAYGALSSVENQAVAVIRNEIAPPINSFLIDSIGGFSPETMALLAKATPEQAAEVLRVVLKKSADSVVAGGSGKLNELWLKLPDGARYFVVDVCAALLVDKLAARVGLKSGEAAKGWDVVKKDTFLDLMHKGGDLFGDFAAAKVGAMIGSYRLMAGAILLLALLVPVLDVVVARRIQAKEQTA